MHVYSVYTCTEYTSCTNSTVALRTHADPAFQNALLNEPGAFYIFCVEVTGVCIAAMAFRAFVCARCQGLVIFQRNLRDNKAKPELPHTPDQTGAPGPLKLARSNRSFSDFVEKWVTYGHFKFQKNLPQDMCNAKQALQIVSRTFFHTLLMAELTQ